MKVLKNLLVAAVSSLLLGLALRAHAVTTPLAVGDANSVGYVNPGIDFGDPVIPGYVNQFVGMGLGTSYTANYANHTNTWVRSGNSFPLTSVAAGGYPSQGNVTNFNIVSGNEYLVAKYDGPNGGLEVWYVGGLSGSVSIPAAAPGTDFGQPKDEALGLSGTWVLNGTPAGVPDGGATLLLLGTALSSLGLLRRKLC